MGDGHPAAEARRRLQRELGDAPLVTIEAFENVMRTQRADYVLAIKVGRKHIYIPEMFTIFFFK